MEEQDVQVQFERSVPYASAVTSTRVGGTTRQFATANIGRKVQASVLREGDQILLALHYEASDLEDEDHAAKASTEAAPVPVSRFFVNTTLPMQTGQPRLVARSSGDQMRVLIVTVDEQ